ncbi:MAG: hypothetical protein ACPGWM_09180 [Flavobacteriales bacterium]
MSSLKSLSDFGAELSSSHELIFNLEEWTQFKWGEGVGQYVIMGCVSETIIKYWGEMSDELQVVESLIGEYLEKGDSEAQNLIYTEFFPELIGTKNSVDQAEILLLLGDTGRKTIELAKMIFFRDGDK